MRVTILGSGTSTGVPMIGCGCAVCTSADPKNRRLRTSALVETGEGNLLIDTSTDLRQQALQFGVRRIDAVLYTHHHADHVNGIDELRSFNFIQQTPIPIYANLATMRRIMAYFEHIFTTSQPEGWTARVVPHTIGPESFTIESHGLARGILSSEHGEREGGTQQALPVGGATQAPVTIQPIPLAHGESETFGYRIGPFAYLTDCKTIPSASWLLLDGVTHVVLDCLREAPHVSHMNCAEALAVVDRLKPQRTVFIHMNHEVDYAAAKYRLPRGVEWGYDGLTMEVSL